MKLILLAIFNIFILNSISSKNLKISDIYKGYPKNFISTDKHNFPINYGPNLSGKPFPVTRFEKRLKRNYFMACCAKGGLSSLKQILTAYDFALKNNFILNDNYGINCNEFSIKASKEFKFTYYNKWKIYGPSKKGNFRVYDSKYKPIFDSALIDKKFTEKEILYLDNTLFINK